MKSADGKQTGGRMIATARTVMMKKAPSQLGRTMVTTRTTMSSMTTSTTTSTRMTSVTTTTKITSLTWRITMAMATTKRISTTFRITTATTMNARQMNAKNAALRTRNRSKSARCWAVTSTRWECNLLQTDTCHYLFCVSFSWWNSFCFHVVFPYSVARRMEDGTILTTKRTRTRTSLTTMTPLLNTTLPTTESKHLDMTCFQSIVMEAKHRPPYARPIGNMLLMTAQLIHTLPLDTIPLFQPCAQPIESILQIMTAHWIHTLPMDTIPPCRILRIMMSVTTHILILTCTPILIQIGLIQICTPTFTQIPI